MKTQIYHCEIGDKGSGASWGNQTLCGIGWPKASTGVSGMFRMSLPEAMSLIIVPRKPSPKFVLFSFPTPAYKLKMVLLWDFGRTDCWESIIAAQSPSYTVYCLDIKLNFLICDYNWGRTSCNFHSSRNHSNRVTLDMLFLLDLLAHISFSSQPDVKVWNFTWNLLAFLLVNLSLNSFAISLWIPVWISPMPDLAQHMLQDILEDFCSFLLRWSFLLGLLFIKSWTQTACSKFASLSGLFSWYGLCISEQEKHMPTCNFIVRWFGSCGWTFLSCLAAFGSCLALWKASYVHILMEMGWGKLPKLWQYVLFASLWCICLVHSSKIFNNWSTPYFGLWEWVTFLASLWFKWHGSYYDISISDFHCNWDIIIPNT